MPAVWASSTPISVLLNQSRQSCHGLEWSRRDPSPRACLAEAAAIKAIQQRNTRGRAPLRPVYDMQQLPRRPRKLNLDHTPTCVLPRLADGTRPITIPKAAASALAEEIVTGRRASPAPPRQVRPADELIDLLEETSQRQFGRRSGVQPSYRSATPPPMEVKLRDPRSPTTRPHSSPSRLRYGSTRSPPFSLTQ